MPRYCYICPECDKAIEIINSIAEVTKPQYCICGAKLKRNFQAESVLVGAGRRSYHKPIVSDSLAMNPNQIAEHRRAFPDIKVLDDGRPVFDNFADHEKYLQKCNIEKVPQKKKRRGKKIA